jgi:hypothetical protein
MFSASCTICSKAVPILKQLLQFRCSERKFSSNKASSRSSLPFFRSNNPSTPGTSSLSEEYGSSKTWRSVRLASNCFASVSAYRSAIIDSGRRSVGTRIVLISTGDHRLISALSSTGLIIERVVVKILVLGTNYHGRLEHLPKKSRCTCSRREKFRKRYLINLMTSSNTNALLGFAQFIMVSDSLQRFELDRQEFPEPASRMKSSRDNDAFSESLRRLVLLYSVRNRWNHNDDPESGTPKSNESERHRHSPG